MSERELFDKNLELASEFSRYVIAHPEIANSIGPDCEVLFLVDSDLELTKYNMGLANKIKSENGKVVFVHIKSLLPKEASRLVNPRVEIPA